MNYSFFLPNLKCGALSIINYFTRFHSVYIFLNLKTYNIGHGNIEKRLKFHSTDMWVVGICICSTTILLNFIFDFALTAPPTIIPSDRLVIKEHLRSIKPCTFLFWRSIFKLWWSCFIIFCVSVCSPNI